MDIQISFMQRDGQTNQRVLTYKLASCKGFKGRAYEMSALALDVCIIFLLSIMSSCVSLHLCEHAWERGSVLVTSEQVERNVLNIKHKLSSTPRSLSCIFEDKLGKVEENIKRTVHCVPRAYCDTCQVCPTNQTRGAGGESE